MDCINRSIGLVGKGGDVLSGKDSKDDKKKEEQPFYIKMPDTPQVVSAEAQRSEQELLANYKAKGPRAETLKPLAIFYSRVGLQEKAYQYLKLWMKHAKNQEEMAESLLMSGQLAEQVKQYDAAITFYKEALKYKCENKLISFFLHNNLAFCLNETSEFNDAMKHCEVAINIDNSRANVYKNFGISLQGLEKYGEAAKIWIKAVHIDISDTRSLKLLEALMVDHGETVKESIPDIEEQLDASRRAATSAKTGRFADWARGLTMN